MAISFSALPAGVTAVDLPCRAFEHVPATEAGSPLSNDGLVILLSWTHHCTFSSHSGCSAVMCRLSAALRFALKEPWWFFKSAAFSANGTSGTEGRTPALKQMRQTWRSRVSIDAYGIFMSRIKVTLSRKRVKHYFPERSA
jgi:hypothetical protein